MSAKHRGLNGVTGASEVASCRQHRRLVRVNQSLFTTGKFRTIDIRRVTSATGISGPVICRRFKKGRNLCTIIISHRVHTLASILVGTLSSPRTRPHRVIRHATLTLLACIRRGTRNFHILAHSSPGASPSGSFGSLLKSVTMHIRSVLASTFGHRRLPTGDIPCCTRVLVNVAICAYRC